MTPGTLRVSFGELPTPLFKLTRAEIRESADSVTIELLGASSGGGGGASPATNYQHTFTLNDNLGQREVLINGKPTPVAHPA